MTSSEKPLYANQRLRRELDRCDQELIDAIERINAFYKGRSDAQIAAFRRQSAQRIAQVLRARDRASSGYADELK